MLKQLPQVGVSSLRDSLEKYPDLAPPPQMLSICAAQSLLKWVSFQLDAPCQKLLSEVAAHHRVAVLISRVMGQA